MSYEIILAVAPTVGIPSNVQYPFVFQLWIIYSFITLIFWVFVNQKDVKRARGQEVVQAKKYIENIPMRVFPDELERYIFEIACWNSKDAPKLARVARRVQAWIEPIMYADVVLNHWFPHADSEMVRLFLRTIESRPPSFFAKNVKSVYLNVHTHEAAPVISVCTGVQNIVCCDALWSQISGRNMDLPGILALSPQRLSLGLRRIFPSPQTPDFCISLFANITHLQITDRLAFAAWPRWCLPRLTHLAFPYSPGRDPTDHIIKQQVCDILSTCWTIQVLLLTTTDRDSTPRLLMSDEPRAVIGPCKVSRLEYEACKKGEDDLWTQAEQFSAMHHSLRSYNSWTCF